MTPTLQCQQIICLGNNGSSSGAITVISTPLVILVRAPDDGISRVPRGRAGAGVVVTPVDSVRGQGRLVLDADRLARAAGALVRVTRLPRLLDREATGDPGDARAG